MEDGTKKCYCCFRGNHVMGKLENTNHNSNSSGSSKALDIDAALNELGMLSTSAVERKTYFQEKKRRELRSVLAQTPPMWLHMPPKSENMHQNLRIDTECQKDVPQQPPNSPVSPPFFVDHYKLRDFDYHHEYENRPLQSRRVRPCGRQRMLSGPDSLILRRAEERNSWHPYRIPRPKLRTDRVPRTRTISASLHEPHESASSITDTMDSASQLALTTKAMETMAIVENGLHSVNPETNLNLPRSRSLESLLRPRDVASTAVDGVSERIENLHVT